MENIGAKLEQAIEALYKKGKLEKEDLLIVGCTTSEIAGGEIGKESSPKLGELVAKTCIEKAKNLEILIGFQCCEHLNRAICMERSTLKSRGYTQVSALPMPEAGGSVAHAAWNMFSHPSLALNVQAEAVIDIGDTFVGMHIKPVAVPLRIPLKSIGQAHLTLAYARPPLIGGERTIYHI